MSDARRRLAAIVAADVAGYSRLMGQDEEGTITALLAHRREVVEPKLAIYHGRIANTAGDSLLIEFPSAVDALRCMIEVQREIAERNEGVPADRRVTFRIGINVGDVVSQGEDLLGDGVNVAARLEAMAPTGGICVSRAVRDQVRDKVDVDLEDLGEVEVKNIARPVRAFRVQGPGDDQPVATGPRPAAAMKPAVAIAAVLAVAAGAGLWWWQDSGIRVPDTADIADRARAVSSIAVEPFANLSDDQGQAYFAKGITEDIMTDLSRVAGLNVTSRSAASRDGHILEGSVRRAGDRIRITAKLIDAQTGDQVWAERFDRGVEGIFDIQDEITARVVSELSRRLGEDTLTPHTRAYTPKVEAYDLYIQGRAKRIPPTPENLAAALAMFDQAIAIDPDFAGGYAGAAYVRVLMYADGSGASASGADLGEALELSRRAVDLDPAFGPAWSSLAEAHLRRRQFAEAHDAFVKAVRASPNDSLMRASYGRFLGYIGRADEGIEQVKQAMRMSPDSLPMLFFLGANYRAAGDFDRAIEALKEHRKRLAGRILPGPTTQLITAYVQTGRFDEAVEEARALLGAVPHFTVDLAIRTHVYESAEDAKTFAEALRKAGIPG